MAWRQIMIWLNRLVHIKSININNSYKSIKGGGRCQYVDVAALIREFQGSHFESQNLGSFGTEERRWIDEKRQFYAFLKSNCNVTHQPKIIEMFLNCSIHREMAKKFTGYVGF